MGMLIGFDSPAVSFAISLSINFHETGESLFFKGDENESQNDSAGID